MLRNRLRVLSALVVAGLLCGVAILRAQAGLGNAQAFAVLAGATVTNTGPSVIDGNVGLHPGTAVTGFPPGIVNGTIHSANFTALQAKNDLITYYNVLTTLPCTQDLTGLDLGSVGPLFAGVYCFDSSAQLTGSLVLDAQFNNAALFVFRIGSTLTTASGSSVSLINGGNRCGVNWRIGSDATLGTATTFIGNLIALTSITLTTGADIIGGRALARNGAVTLDTNDISITGCAAPLPVPSPGPAPVPTLAAWAAIALSGLLALGGMAALRQRQSRAEQPSRR
jgi:hypothetical protein